LNFTYIYILFSYTQETWPLLGGGGELFGVIKFHEGKVLLFPKNKKRSTNLDLFHIFVDGKTLYPLIYTLHFKPYTLHLTPYTLHLTPYTLHLNTYTLHLTSYILHLTSCILHLASYILHITSNIILHLTSYYV
jgi:hypothetical protein